MESLALRLAPRSPFGTPLLGDALFGHLCWAVRNRHGEGPLHELLEGYTQGRPFVVVSDAFPAGHVPRPALPLSRLGEVGPTERKRAKRLRWLPWAALSRPPGEWLALAVEESALVETRESAQPHNSINRLTGTTGRGGFAPYTMTQRWHASEAGFDVHVRLDPDRCAREDLVRLFEDIGAAGFGRDASIGLGRFSVSEVPADLPPPPPDADAWLTLAPCAPQGQGFVPERSFYEVFTRFGRHGDQAVHLGNPFKTPVLAARAGAVLTPAAMRPVAHVGRGLGGDGALSRAIPETVQQGYAPVLGLALWKELRP
jgi:CRISPR-associated protein Csm4